MKVALVTRSTFQSAYGGDTVQVMETARQLRLLGIDATVTTTQDLRSSDRYDLLHFFNITRPADMLRHTRRHDIPYVITPIWIDYSPYDRYNRNGIAGKIFRHLEPATIEYLKTAARWINGNEIYPGNYYLASGHRRSMQYNLENASALFCNSEAEFATLAMQFKQLPPYHIITAGVDEKIFQPVPSIAKEKRMVLCAGRIEGIKNQLQLIRALNNTDYRLVLIGDAAPNQQAYYKACRQVAAANIQFIPHLSHDALKSYYQKAAVHVLPSWYESCGLASLEAAAMGCQVVATRNGFASSYLGDDAFYCDPSSVNSIREAVDKAAACETTNGLPRKIREQYTWRNAALQTSLAYQQILSSQ